MKSKNAYVLTISILALILSTIQITPQTARARPSRRHLDSQDSSARTMRKVPVSLHPPAPKPPSLRQL
jgi:hypothetical protein